MSTIQTGHYFVGSYVNAMVDMLNASLVSKTHAILMSPPGYGKTAIPKRALEQVIPDSHSLIPVTPSTSPAVINGMVNNEVLIKHSRYELVTDGTPYDPNMNVVILDELFRGNDPLYDAALHALDPEKQDNVVVWATSNFTASGDRVKALIDRIGLWMWVDAQIDDMKQMVISSMMSNGKPSVKGMIDWKTVQDVRQAQAGLKAANTVADYIVFLSEECANEGLHVHPRQATHWWKLLYYNGVYATGQADFDTLPEQATRVIKWAWPTQSREEAGKWQQIATALTDKVGAAIDAVLANAVTEFKRVAGITDNAQRGAQVPTLGRLLADSQSDLRGLGKDPRIDSAIATLSTWFAQAIDGKAPKLNS